MYKYFQDFKIRKLQEASKPENERQIVSWLPPTPKLSEGIRTLLHMPGTVFNTPSFEKGLASAFVKACQAPTPDGNYLRYTGPKCGLNPNNANYIMKV